MRNVIFTTLLVMCITGLAYAQEAWFESAEASAVDYGVSVSRDIPAEEKADKDRADVNIVDVTDIESEGTEAATSAVSLAKDPAGSGKGIGTGDVVGGVIREIR